MRRLLFMASYFVVFAAFAQSVLSPGDLAIVHYNSDNPDQISFVCLSPVDSGTSVHFTDKGWLSSQSFRSGEGVFNWTSTKSYSCGDVITLDSISPIALSSTGDQVFVFQDSVSAPRFITAFNNEGAGVWQTTASSANTSALPSVLTNGLNAIALNEADNVVYDSSLSGSRSGLSALIFNKLSFNTSNSTRQAWSGAFSISSGCSLPVEWLDIYVSDNEGHPLLVWETASEINSQYFQIENSLDGIEFNAINQIPASGNSSEIIRYEFPLTDGLSGYIRIKQVDYDQAFSYSKILHLKKLNSINLFSLYNNYSIAANGEFELEVYNSLGERMLTKKGNTSLILNGSELGKGWLYFNIKSSYESRSYKVYRSY